MRENGAGSDAGLLATYTYDPLSRRDTLTRGNATTTVFDFDLASRLSSLNHNLGGTNHDATFSFVYTDASQLASRQSSNDALAAWTVIPRSDTYTANGLNQYSSVTGITYNHDANGNLQSNGARTFSYDLENRLTAVTGTPSMTLGYDPLGRLKQTASGGITTDYLYEGDRLIAEYNGSTLLRRYVHGPGVDEPIVWYEGTGLNDRRWLHADERGSVIAETNGSGTATVYSYGPYGEPSNWVGSRFRYTGQITLPEVGLYHYKARVYDPQHGRFLQTDPVGYGDQLNLYAYAANDPPTKTDPTGEFWVAVGAAISGGVQVVSAYRRGTLNSWQGLGRVATATIAGAAGGGAAGVIGRQIVGRGVAAITGRAGANAVVGGATGAAQTEVNARIESGGQSGASLEKLVSGAVESAAFAAGGSALGDLVGNAAYQAAGGARGEAAAAAAEVDRMVQGQGMPGGDVPGSGSYIDVSSPTPPSQVGEVLGQGAGAIIGAFQPAAQPNCPTSAGDTCP